MSTEQKTYPSQFEKVKAITDQLEAGIQALFESDKFKQYLKTLSKFHDYSLNNTILIAMQKPDATLVAGYTAWQKQFGRQVQKGENGIRILAPTPYKKKMEVWNSQENRTPSRPDHAAGAHCAKQTRLTSGGRLSSFAVLRRRRL